MTDKLNGKVIIIFIQPQMYCNVTFSAEGPLLKEKGCPSVVGTHVKTLLGGYHHNVWCRPMNAPSIFCALLIVLMHSMTYCRDRLDG